MIVTVVTESVLLSISVSFDNTFPFFATFSGVDGVSLNTIGASFTGITVILTFAVLVDTPSETV